MVAAEARNFLKILTSKDRVYFLHFIWDLTTCLSKVSRVFQDRMTTVEETELTAAKAVLEFLKSVYGHPFNPFILLTLCYPTYQPKEVALNVHVFLLFVNIHHNNHDSFV